MKKFYAIAGIISGVLLLVGGVLLGIGLMSGADKNFKLFDKINMSFGMSELSVQEYTELDDFSSVDINLNLADLEIVASDNGEYGIEYKLYSDNIKCDVQNDSLIFRENKGKIGFNFNLGFLGAEDTYVKIYVPEKELESIKISADMGTIKLNHIFAKNVNIDADMGSVVFAGMVTETFTAELDMGSADIEGWLDCDIDVSCDMGNLDITTYFSSSAYKLNVNSDMGEETFNYNGGTEISSNNFIKADCDMGSIEITFKDAP